MIFLECDNDEAVVRGLGFPRAIIEHHSSKGRVAKFLQKAIGTGHIGLVDEDPGAAPPPYFHQFQLADDLPKLALARFRHRSDPKELIEIKPDLEPWLYEAARQSGINPKDYHLPERHGQLHDNPKAYASRVIELVKGLIGAGSPRLLHLQSWLAGH